MTLLKETKKEDHTEKTEKAKLDWERLVKSGKITLGFTEKQKPEERPKNKIKR